MNPTVQNCTEHVVDQQIAYVEEIFDQIQRIMGMNIDSTTMKYEIQKLMNDKNKEKIINELIKLAQALKIKQASIQIIE